MLPLQGDPDIFECGEMRKNRGDLERTHQPQPSHIGRRHRGNVLAPVNDLTGGRLKEFGQQIEAGGFARPIWTDQRMDAATADPKIDVANGRKARELLTQSASLENVLVSQSHFPHHCRGDPRMAYRLPGKPSYDPLGSRVRAAASVREYAVNGRPYASRKRRSGAERAAEDSTLVQLLGHKDWLSPTFSALAGAEPRQALINGVSMPSGGFIEYLPVTAIMMKNFQNGSKLWISRAPIHRSSDRSSSGTC